MSNSDTNEVDYIYILIKEADISDAIINRSTSTKCNASCLRSVVFKKSYLVISVDDEYKVMKFKKSEIIHSAVINAYDWYSQADMLALVCEYCAETVEADTVSV